MLIANGEFSDPSFKSFNVVEDINILSSKLPHKKIGNFIVDGYIINKSKEHTENMLRSFFKNKGMDNTLFIYFNCHTVVEGGEIYFIMNNTNSSMLNSTALSADFVKDLMLNCESDKQVLVLDCCLKPLDDSSIDLYDYFDNMGDGRIVITACDFNEEFGLEESISNNESTYVRSPFTKYIIQGLDGMADAEMDGDISAIELFNYVRKEVIDNDKNVSPQIIGNSPDIIIANNPHIPTISCKKSEVERTIEAMKHPLSEDDKKYLERHLAKKYKDYSLWWIKIADGDSHEELGKEAALYLRTALHHNIKIAVSCGKTLFETIYSLDVTGKSYITVYPLSVYPSSRVTNIDSNILTAFCMAKLSKSDSSTDVTAYLLQACVGSDGPISKYSKENTENLLEEASKANYFLLGIGNPMNPHANISNFFDNAELSPSGIGAVGEIIYHLFDKDGFFILDKDLNAGDKARIESYYRQFINLSLDQLDRIRKSVGVNLIAVAGGEDKHNAIFGAIKAGLVRTLITDLETAKWLYSQHLGDFKKSSYTKGLRGAIIGANPIHLHV